MRLLNLTLIKRDPLILGGAAHCYNVYYSKQKVVYLFNILNIKTIMFYTSKVNFSKEFMKNSAITDKRIAMQLVHKVMDELSIDDLLKLFTFEKIDPYSNESERILNDPLESENKKAIILHLRERNMVELSIELDLED